MRTPRQLEAIEALRKYGSVNAAADALNLTRSGLSGVLRNARLTPEEKAELYTGTALNVSRARDPAVDQAMAAVNTGLVPSVTWIKTKPTDDAPGYSVMLRPQEVTPEEVAEAIRAALEGMEPAEPVQVPAQVMEDLCSVYPLMDAHVGQHSWARETGGADYDLKLAAQDMRHAFAKVLAITPASKRAILIIGGDFFHSDDTRAETPANRHKLDVDGRFYKVLDVGIGIIAETVHKLLQKHQEVLVRVLRGNHDPHSSLTLNFALAERYREDPRVMVEKDPRDLFMHQWGKCAIFAHHGDKGKPQQMAMYLSDVCPFWSEARHRHYFTGHVHHDQAKDFGPLRWESLRAFCPPDAYAASMGYGGRRALQSLTFHKADGLVLRALDPIERAA
jgi:hypothetical protein